MSLYNFPKQLPAKRVPLYDRIWSSEEYENFSQTVECIVEYEEYRCGRSLGVSNYYCQYQNREWARISLLGYLMGIISVQSSPRELWHWNHELVEQTFSSDPEKDEEMMETYCDNSIPYDFVYGGRVCGTPVRTFWLK